MRRFKSGKASTDSDGSEEDNISFKRSKRRRKSTLDEDAHDGPVSHSGLGHTNDGEFNNGRDPRNGVIKIVKSSEFAVIKETKLESNISHESRTSVIVNGRETSSSTKDSAKLTYKATATEIMKQMGFNKDKGLGKLMNDHEIATAKLDQIQKALNETGISIDDADLDFEMEINIEEEVRWIPPTLPKHLLDYDTLCTWRKTGPKKTSISGETEFIDPVVLKNVIGLRKCFNVLNIVEYQQLRARCNLFETIGKGPFISRAAMKMANLDTILSSALTQPTTNSVDKQSTIGPNELFYFADVCAGPGGFSEYVLFRRKWGAKGFGMTLKDPDLDFDIWSFFNGSPESFEPIYGPANDGNVYNPSNTTAFVNYVLSSSDNRGVHLLMADGGFEVENKELQEVESAQIFLSQCLLAISVVRPGGTFVCKFFDALTPFTVGLLYLMYLSFELISLHKPNASRPANAERYLICKWKKEDTGGILNYLHACHTFLWKSQSESRRSSCLLELVPLEILKESKEFYNYILRSNTSITRQQIESLKRMVVFSRDANLKDPRQESIRRKCLHYWKIPDTPGGRLMINLATPDKMFANMIGKQSSEFLGCQDYDLSEHNLDAFVRSPFDWRIVVVGSTPQEKNQGFYLSLGGERIYRFDGKVWLHIQEKLELCKDTLVYGEFVDEIYGKKPNQALVRTFHIVDAMVLGGTDIRGLHYTARHEVCIKFARSMNKPSRSDICHVRAKVPVRMENIADVFDRLENRIVTNSGTNAQLVCPVDHTDETLPFIKPKGVLFLKITKDPWIMALSSRSNRKYYFNISTGSSSYEIIPDAISSFDYTMQHRIVWWWNKELRTLMSTQDVTDKSRPITIPEGQLNPHTLLNFVGGAWQDNRTS